MIRMLLQKTSFIVKLCLFVLFLAAGFFVFGTSAQANGVGYNVSERSEAAYPDRRIRFMPSVPQHMRTKVALAAAHYNMTVGTRITIGSDTVMKSLLAGDITIAVQDNLMCDGVRARGCSYNTTDYVSGQSVKHKTHLIFSTSIFNSNTEMGTIMHELGHAFGLSHYEEIFEGQLQVMSTKVFEKNNLRSGDIAGFRMLINNFDRPKGNFESARIVGPKKVRITGWAFDANTVPSTGSVHVYVNNRFSAEIQSNKFRPDVKRIFNTVGPSHGFSEEITLPSGSNNICVYAMNQGHGSVNPLLGCRRVQVGGNPLGSLDATSTMGPQQTTVRGWVVDPDVAEPIAVHTYVDGKFVGAVLADGLRPDVGRAFPGYGDAHGYSMVLPRQQPGLHRVCIFGINVGSGNTNTLLGCRNFVTPGGNPLGSIDVIRQEGENVRISGWALDPDTGDSVEIFVNGGSNRLSAAFANASRPDVGRIFPGYGNSKGYTFVIPVQPGQQTFCVVAKNIGKGKDSTIGCKTVIVKAASPPPSSTTSTVPAPSTSTTTVVPSETTVPKETTISTITESTK